MPESIEWCLYAWGRTPDDNWIEESMRAAGIWNESVGCTDASGAGTARWVVDQYGEYGYASSNTTGVSFDDVASEARLGKHPLAMNGAAWYHWTGVRGYDSASDRLLLANPAPGWKGVQQTMNRAQFASLGPFNMVRVQHPAAEAGPPVLDYSPWTDNGLVGSGLIGMMKEDGVLPAQRWSTWLPLGAMPADVEECLSQDGRVYRWILSTNRGYRYSPN